MPIAVFEASVNQWRLDISFLSHHLLSDLQSIFGMPLGKVDSYFDGNVLLEHRTALKTHLDRLSSTRLVLGTAQDLIDEWTLLVEGFLEIDSVFEFYHFYVPPNGHLLGDQQGLQTELEHGINAFDRAYTKIHTMSK